MISRCTEKVEIKQKNAESSKKFQVLIKNKVFHDARKTGISQLTHHK